MAPDDAPTRPITLPDPDGPEGRRSPRARAVLALGVVLLSAGTPLAQATPVAQATTVTDAGAPPAGSTRADGRPPALPTRGASTVEAITDIWDRGGRGRR